MTSLRHSPPRSKKESSDANDQPAAIEKPAVESARDAARRERAEVKRAALEARKQAVQAKRARRAIESDRIVEAPREPKVGFAERRRQAKVEKQGRAQAEPVPGGKRWGLVLAGLVGAVGLLCSIVLALGALLVALGAQDGNSVYDIVAPICDALVGPIRDLFSFTGANAEVKESLVAWGSGSIGYLVVGLFAQSFLRARFDDN